MSHGSGGQGLIAIFVHWAEAAGAFALAAFFGLVRYLQVFLDKPRPPFEFLIALIQAITAGSAGVAAWWALSEWEVGPGWLAFSVGIVGWGGANFLEIFKEALRDYFLRKTGKAADKDAAH